MEKKYPEGSLGAVLDHTPVPLRFGTSGRRGKVVDLTQLEIYICASAELEYLKSLPKDQGGIQEGEEFYIAYDLRPSSTRFVPEQGGRGEIAQAIVQAVRDAGLKPVNLGPIPTPALMAYAVERKRGSMMVTGSHIPFDRNGYKTNSSRGELMKEDEGPINERVAQWRDRLYAQPYEESPFDRSGRFKVGHMDLPPVDPDGARSFVNRYVSFFGGRGDLQGMRVIVYQHSAVGRDLLVEVLQKLGAEVIPVGRSDEFVAIDTENISDELLAEIQQWVDQVGAERGPIDAVVSTDGDSDRPLLIAVDTVQNTPQWRGKVRFYGGDLVGMIVAEYLKADAVVVPISCNDAIDRGNLRHALQPKTRIGSPYVIAGMRRAKAAGFQRVCGWEANGGFLLGTDLVENGRILKALETRDSFLPILCILFAAKEQGVPISTLFARLPARFSRASLLRNFPRERGRAIVQKLSPEDPQIKEVRMEDGQFRFFDAEGQPLTEQPGWQEEVRRIVEVLPRFFRPEEGFGRPVRLNFLDGVRIWFDNGDVAHVRPSGNADEFRIYAVADSQERADQIVKLGVQEPDGILRRLERWLIESES